MSKLARFTAYLALCLIPVATSAQEFPAGSTTPTAAELRQHIAGKVFSVKTATSTWRLQINDNGYYFVNVGNYADTGSWTAEDGRWCTKPQKTSAACNDVRISDGVLLLKRSNGEVVRFAPH